MSRAAQEMQRIADEMAKARRQPTKKGRQAVAHDEELEDVTEGEAHDEHRATGTPVDEAAQPAAAAEEQTMASETPSAIRSRKWREAQKKNKGGKAKKAKAAKPRKAAAGGAPGEGKTMVKTKGDKKWSFVSTSTALAHRAFSALLREVQANPEAPENAGLAERLQKIVDRLVE